MVCVHGLDEINCPICRMSSSIRPPNNLNLKAFNQNPFKIENPYFKKHITSENKLIKKDKIDSGNILEPKLIHQIPRPYFLNQVPVFGSSFLNESLNNFEISKNNKIGISKKIPLTKPELDFESED